MSRTPAGLGWRQFGPILAVQFIGTLGYSIAIPFLVFLVADFGGAPWTYGIIGATYSACQLVGAPILGRWSDRAGRRPVLIASQVGTMAAWCIFLVALTLPMQTLFSFGGATLTVPLLLVFAARALDGSTGGNISVANAYVADLTQDDKSGRQVAFGRMAMAASLGFAIGPALAGLLHATPLGYTGPIAAAAAISGVATVLCVLLPDPTARCPVGGPDQPALTRIVGQQQRRCDRATPPRRPGVLRRPRIVGLLIATFVQFLAFNLFYAGFPIHADLALEWNAGRMGLFFAVMSGVMIVAQGPLLRFATDRFASSAVFVVGMLGLVGAFILFTLPDRWALFTGAVLFAVGNGLAWPTFQTRLAGAAGDSDQGTVQGAATGAGSLASIVGLIAGGVLYPLFGIGLFLAGSALFLLVAAATPIWFREPTGQERD